MFVDIIGPYVIRIKGQKENLHLKSVTVIDPITGWFEIVQYNDKIVISIVNFFETTWLSGYSRPMEIMYDQGSEFIGNHFRESLI